MMRKKKGLYIVFLLFLAVILTLIFKITEPKIEYDQTVIVNDSLLNDSSILDAGSSKDLNEQFYLLKNIDQGEYAIETDNVKKPFFCYDTEICNAIRFCITPKENSDYLITISNQPDLDIIVIRQRKILRNCKVNDLKVNRNDDFVRYSYRMEKGNTYDIYIVNRNEHPIKSEVQIEQDNWVYAPYGWYAQYGKNNVYYFSYPYLLKIRRKYIVASISDEHYDDEDLKEICNEDLTQYAQLFSRSIYICALSNDKSENFREHFETYLMNEHFLNDIIDSKFNFILITKGKGRSYSVSYDKWSQKNYICKYYKHTRVSDYVIYSEQKGEINAYTDLEWEKYIK